jgi:exopolyphosphatase/guanosine-5'-triphosphate,3'-diphosphate pyrophosphatase
MLPARGALRAGLLYDLLGRREDHDVRHPTVQRWQARYGVDAGLARRVANTAERFVRALLPGIGAESLQELRFASELHEIGLAVSHSEHHKHAAYLVRNGDLAGFSETEQEAIATLVMGQRGNLRKVIDSLWDPVRSAQLLSLRLAALFHHARREVPLPRWKLRAGRSFELSIDAQWLERHPLTRHLLEEEVEHWARVGIRLVVKAS